jgi:hypothetical protein
MDPAPPPAPPHAPVNPLGGTMVADSNLGFNPYGAPNPYGPPPGAAPQAAPYAPPAGGYGTPGQPGGYGTPGQSGGYGTPGQPAPGYGQPPPGGGYGAPQQPQYGGAQPPGGYGAPQQPQYGGAQPPGGYGAPGGFTPPQDQYGMGGGAPMVPMGGGGGGRGPIGKIRNPIMTIVFSMLCFIYAIIQIWGMLNELKAFRGKDDLNPIMFFIPILGYIELWKLNEKVLDAKRMAGVPNAQVASPVLYLFFAVFFLPSDLNEIWQAASGGQLPPA